MHSNRGSAFSATLRYNVVYNTAGVACRDTSDIKPSGVPQYGEPHYEVGALYVKMFGREQSGRGQQQHSKQHQGTRAYGCLWV